MNPAQESFIGGGIMVNGGSSGSNAGPPSVSGEINLGGGPGSGGPGSLGGLGGSGPTTDNLGSNSNSIPLIDVSESELKQMEQYCTALYDASDTSLMREAHQILLPISDDPSKIPLLFEVMRRTQDMYAIMYASAALKKLITQHWTAVSDRMKLDAKEFCFQFLSARAEEAQRIGNSNPQQRKQIHQFVGGLIRFLARLLKHAWLEGPKHQDLVERVDSLFLNNRSVQHGIIGLSIFAETTMDMQPSTTSRLVSRFRRTALCFRDSALPDIFERAISTLQKLIKGEAIELVSSTDKTQEQNLCKELLNLIHSCLSFDFMGTSPDEASDDISSVMVPHSWAILREESVCNLFFETYSLLCVNQRTDLAYKASDILVLLASLRRSFWNKEEDRNKLLNTMILGTSGILASSMGLKDPQCYHSICRLLGKLNASHQLTELTANSSFQNWLNAIYSFTTESLISWDSNLNSKHYLLQFWSSLVSPTTYMRERAPPGLEETIQRITVSYLESRIAMADSINIRQTESDWVDPLEDEVLRSEQLDVLSNLGRCRYQATAQCVLKHFEYILTQAKQNSINPDLFERKMAWLVYMIGALIAGHANSSNKSPSSLLPGMPQGYGGASDLSKTGSKESPTNNGSNSNKSNPQDPNYVAPPHVINGELATRVFGLMALTDPDPQGRILLEQAYLYFLEQFRKVYVNEQARNLSSSRSSNIEVNDMEERLVSVLGVKDTNSILTLLINKIGKNLQSRCDNEAVLQKTLGLFHELAASINIVPIDRSPPHLVVSGKLMLQNETVVYIMRNHQNAEFSFLYTANANTLRYGRLRTQYYLTLGKLLFLEPMSDKISGGSSSLSSNATTGGNGGGNSIKPPSFEEFMRPFGTIIEQLMALHSSGQLSMMSKAASDNTGPPGSNSSNTNQNTNQNQSISNYRQTKLVIVGLCRDLRGLCEACSTSDCYTQLFSWLIPNQTLAQENNNRITIFYKILDTFWDDHEITTPLLKFMSELCLNKAQRINFDPASPNGILLFREVGKTLRTYGDRILQKDFGDLDKSKHPGPNSSSKTNNSSMLDDGNSMAVANKDLYQQKYKGIGIALSMFSQALLGGYCNFGVFELYGDTSLNESMTTALRMCFAIPQVELRSYYKTLKPFYVFIEIACKQHKQMVLNLPPDELAKLLHNIEDGLSGFDISAYMQSCGVVDCIASYFVEARKKGPSTSEGMLCHNFLQQQPDSLKRILGVIFTLVISGEFSSSWSLSRPLLPLIQLHMDEYQNIRDRYISQQLEERQDKLRKYFDDLLREVEDDNLTNRNRDHFTRQLYNFATMWRPEKVINSTTGEIDIAPGVIIVKKDQRIDGSDQFSGSSDSSGMGQISGHEI